jgi:high affinity sulfate transporter 1
MDPRHDAPQQSPLPSGVQPTGRDRLLTAISNRVPGVRIARSYPRGWLVSDLVAGLVLAGLLVPQGMAYAQLAGLPPTTGLYTTVIGLVAYAVFGPSRILVLGPDSALGPLIAVAILPLAAGSSSRAILLASALSVMVGLLAIGLGAGRLGFVADLLSKPVRTGYLAGLAITIFVSQIPKLFGFSAAGDNVGAQLAAFFANLPRTSYYSLAIGIGTVVTIVLLRRIPKVPAVLIAVAGATVLSALLDLAAKGVPVVGVLPQGLPSFQLPIVPLRDIGTLALAAGGIAIVSLADTVSTSASFAGRRGETVDANQELIAVGLANVFSGLFQGFPTSGSASRTAVAEESGSRSQLTGVAAAVVIALMLVALPWLVRSLPQSALAGVVIVAAMSLFDARELSRYLRVRRSEFIQSVVALSGVVVLGVLGGLGLAVVVSVLNFFRRAWWPQDAVLGKTADLAGFHDLRFHPDAKRILGLILYRWDAPLFFANARAFHDRIHELIAENPEPVNWVIVYANAITDIEVTAADMLSELDVELNARGIHLVFAGLKDPVYQHVCGYQLQREIVPEHFFPNLTAAVRAYLSEYHVDDELERELESSGPTTPQPEVAHDTVHHHRMDRAGPAE